MYKIIASGSDGNAVLYCGSILVDCGVTFNKIKPYINDIQLILLTHEHSDHINISTLKRICFERPSLRIGCGEFMVKHLDGIKNIDVYKPIQRYVYGSFEISPINLYHDVLNFGYRIFKDGKKIFHAIDTCHLQGIEAKNYDLYAIESNYNEETIHDEIKSKVSKGEFCYQKGVINSHLSEQQARNFYFENKGENSKLIRLHEHSNKF